MKTIIKKINLNVNEPNNYQLIHAMQGDNNTVEIIATIWNGNMLYNIDTDRIALEWQSPSGNKKDYPIKEYTTNTITFILKNDMLVENGDYIFCIRFDYENNDSLRTFCSTMRVSKAPFGQIMKTEIVTITELVNQTKEYYNKLISEKGKANGIATLDASTKVPINELYEATTSSKGITQLEDSVTSNSTTTAATPNSIKTVNDALTAEVDRATKAEEKLAPLASPTLTGTPTAPTASTGNNTTQIATTAFVQTAVSNGIAASDAMIIKGTIGTNGTVTTLPATYNIGWTYRVVTAGTYAGQVCEIGDLIIALIDRNGFGNTDSDWCVAQTNINGAITNIKSGDAYIDCSQSGSVVTITHKNVARTNTTSTASPSNGGTFTAIDSVTSDAQGHITNVNTKTITLPTFKAENVTAESIGALPKDGTAAKANKIIDSGDSRELTFAYSKPGLNYSEFSWIAAWNGDELRAVSKEQLAAKLGLGSAAYTTDWEHCYLAVPCTIASQIANGIYLGGGSATVNSDFKELFVVNISNACLLNYSWSGTTITVQVLKSGSSPTTLNLYYLKRRS